MATITTSDILSKDLNSLKTQTNGIYDHRGYNAHISPFGDQVHAQRTDDVSVKFQYNNAPYELDTAVAGTGVITNTDSKGIVSTGAGVGTATITSRDIIRYKPGHEAFAYFTAVFGTPDANAEQRIGCFDDEDGFWIGYQGTDFGMAVRNEGVDTFIKQSTWNGDQLLVGDFVLDPSKMNIYRISYGWLGIAPIILEVSADNGKNWTVAHTVDLRNAQAVPTTQNPMVPIKMEVVSTSAPSAEVTLATSSWNGGTIGGKDTETSSVNRSFSIDAGTKSVSANTLTNLLTVTNASTFQSKANHVKSQLMFISASADGTKPVKITAFKDATVAGSPSFTEVDADSSTLSYDVAGTTVSGGSLVFPFTLAKAGSKDLYTKDFGLFLSPGETVTFAALSSSTTDVTLTVRERSFF